MMKNSKLKFSKDMQNISRSKSFGRFVLIVIVWKLSAQFVCQSSKVLKLNKKGSPGVRSPYYLVSKPNASPWMDKA